ncbi:signal transduction histidine kinase [Salinibacter ruber]|uniref:histidine kinase n=1 Tax=Salinibacter ruber TaxID=146919 RepID=A0A9X2TCR3_9BACT|nr:ATP-binding protein [Salinibacter ruber]MCS3676259.1 signal transduction histidine kinase [Salinibacter ruber]MCS3679546.1 signal transduction histidine kinase [Salinibacter ruber]
MNLRALISRLSISTRLTLWFGTSLLVLLALFVAGLYVSVHLGLHDDLEARLREEAAAVQAHHEAHGFDLTGSSSTASHELQSTPGTFVRLLGPGGDVARASPSFQARPPLSVELPSSRTSTVKTRTWGGTSAQSLYVPFQNESSAVAWMEVTKLQSPIHRQLHALRGWLLLGIVGGVGIAMLGGYGLARRALRPVAALTAAANDMQDRPTGTLPTDFGVKDELTDLADTFNDLIGRLRDSLQRERRFRADAAHNMFTPLTAIQSELDVTLRNPRSETEYREALQVVQQHTETLSSILEELMTLSRIEARTDRPGPARIDVSRQVESRVRRAQQAHPEAASIEWQGEAGLDAPVSPEDLDLVVDHLLDNALKYTPREGRVKVQVAQEKTDVVLRVSDSGIGFDTEAADRIFERFYRTGPAEQQAEGGGLGLPIVKAIAESYGGTVTAWSSGQGEGSTFEVRVPLR